MSTQDLRTMSVDLLLALLFDDMREEARAQLLKAQHAVEAAIIHEERNR